MNIDSLTHKKTQVDAEADTGRQEVQQGKGHPDAPRVGMDPAGEAPHCLMVTSQYLAWLSFLLTFHRRVNSSSWVFATAVCTQLAFECNRVQQLDGLHTLPAGMAVIPAEATSTL